MKSFCQIDCSLSVTFTRATKCSKVSIRSLGRSCLSSHCQAIQRNTQAAPEWKH